MSEETSKLFGKLENSRDQPSREPLENQIVSSIYKALGVTDKDKNIAQKLSKIPNDPDKLRKIIAKIRGKAPPYRKNVTELADIRDLFLFFPYEIYIIASGEDASADFQRFLKTQNYLPDGQGWIEMILRLIFNTHSTSYVKEKRISLNQAVAKYILGSEDFPHLSQIMTVLDHLHAQEYSDISRLSALDHTDPQTPLYTRVSQEIVALAQDPKIQHLLTQTRISQQDQLDIKKIAEQKINLYLQLFEQIELLPVSAITLDSQDQV